MDEDVYLVEAEASGSRSAKNPWSLDLPEGSSPLTCPLLAYQSH